MVRSGDPKQYSGADSFADIQIQDFFLSDHVDFNGAFGDKPAHHDMEPAEALGCCDHGRPLDCQNHFTTEQKLPSSDLDRDLTGL